MTLFNEIKNRLLKNVKKDEDLDSDLKFIIEYCNDNYIFSKSQLKNIKKDEEGFIYYDINGIKVYDGFYLFEDGELGITRALKRFTTTKRNQIVEKQRKIGESKNGKTSLIDGLWIDREKNNIFSVSKIVVLEENRSAVGYVGHECFDWDTEAFAEDTESGKLVLYNKFINKIDNPFDVSIGLFNREKGCVDISSYVKKDAKYSIDEKQNELQIISIEKNSESEKLEEVETTLNENGKLICKDIKTRDDNCSCR